jgi:hypothetical protein
MLGVLLPPAVIAEGLIAASLDEEARAAQEEFAESFMREVGAGIGPGTSAFIAVIDDRWVPEVARGLRGYHRLARRDP